MFSHSSHLGSAGPTCDDVMNGFLVRETLEVVNISLFLLPVCFAFLGTVALFHDTFLPWIINDCTIPNIVGDKQHNHLKR